ncbi:MAG: alanine--tRNA ligase [Planctomycetes bacterium]|jgi:alanyl-tRNA synthetase|nr:alanine--tRNA ligase [Planctomycetota bacterium]
MNRLRPDEIRRSFLTFFAERGHTVVPSDSLVPANDPTLLFTGAGMNQFKDLFLGRGEMPYTRAASSQKCFRTGDLEQVGRTTYHHTFFEMLGNFSFGDYFKRDAIVWAWDFLTRVCGLPAERLSVTVYTDDDEAFGIWRDEVRLPPERVTRLGAKSNFWPSNAPEAGPNGVCGPCSEIFYDYGAEYSCGPGCRKEDCDCPRYTEVWNLVFTQFNRVGVNRLEPLPRRNIDTGMGFERLVAVMNGKLSTFDTDLFMPLIARIAELSRTEYVFASEAGVHMRRVADHARAAVFCLLDGVKPGRDGREFVVRRVIRRAARDGIWLGIDRPFLAELAPVVAEVMGAAYPAVIDNLAEVARAIRSEENRFRDTFASGMGLLQGEIGKVLAAGGRVLPGEVAFRLHDERGFPADVTEDCLREHGLSLDREGFEQAMEARRAESRGLFEDVDIFARGPLAEVRATHGPSVFTGYGTVEDEGAVLALVRGESLVDEAGAGEEVMVVTDRTPFYAESGGQIGDTGRIESAGGRLEVSQTTSLEGVFAMSGRVVEGVLRKGDRVKLLVDRERRDAIRRNHTATHLLHRALRGQLGTSVTQAGSLVAPDRLRFDFHHEGSLDPARLRSLEEEVNRAIVQNTPVSVEEMDFREARSSGAMALFGEKYGERVRVVSVGDYSRELCGGTHCRATGDIGSFRILSESAIGAGLRRVEAITGLSVLERAAAEQAILRDLCGLLKGRPEDLPARVQGLRDQVRELTQRLDKALKAGSREGPEQERETLANGVELVFARYRGPFEMKHLLAAADRLRETTVPLVAFLATGEGGTVSVVVTASAPAVAAGFDAGAAVREAARAVGGGGGGRASLGQGRGKNPDGLPAALESLRRIASALSLS